MASQRKSHVFRVTGLLRDGPDTDLRTALRETLQDNFTDDERSQIKAEITVAPSCYEADTQRVALVRFHGGIPQFLGELRVDPLGDWQIEMGDCDINFDCHFFGFTQLYTPDENEAVIADIIAIAGLDGHAYGSWQGRGNLGRMWLRDFLSKDLPRCRTMIYGYNSKLSSHGVDTILDYGRELMEEIKKIRNTRELQQRPLFFIAHSFGGIILAHCLVKAVQTMEDDHPAITSLYRATYGMLLFAIPHKGLMVDDIQQILGGNGNHLRQQLLQQISNKSDLLVHQLADFKNLIRDRKVVSFYETEQTRQLVYDSDSRRWRRTGDFITTVNVNSALLQLPDHIEDKVPLHADHSMIVKFDARNAAGYRTALDKLQQFEKEALKVVAARFSRVPNHPRLSTVPFKKDTMFVGREDIILEIQKRHELGIGQRPDRIALVGLAGVGKSQIAIEYSHRVRGFLPNASIFWVHASNVVRFEQGYQQIASVGDIRGRNDPKTNILQLVYQWLCDERNGNWFMVLDNVDDDNIFFNVDNSVGRIPLVNVLPQVSHGLILITSRNRLAAQNLVGNLDHVIGVEPMNEEDSLALLRTRNRNSQSPVGDEKLLVEALEYIPLAITQAGSYIANRSPRITVSKYLQLFHDSESNQSHLLNHEDARDIRRDSSIRHAVVTTWQLSFEQIRHDRPAAANLLALISMFDRHGIPEYLLHDDLDSLDFEDTLAPLLSFSLVRFEIAQQAFEMHRLVQLSVRKWLKLHNQLEKWRETSVAILMKIFPNGQYDSWPTCQVLLPHAKEVLSHVSNNGTDRLNWAALANNTGWYLLLRGQYDEAVSIHRRSLEQREQLLGHEHIDTLKSISNLGSALEKQGKYEEAEIIHRRALDYREKVFGYEHPDTLTSVDNLGLALERQGKYRAAESMHRRALEGRKKALGHEHPDTLTSINNLGWALEEQGKYSEVEGMYRQALKGYEKALGNDHPDTLICVSHLGLALQEQGKFEEAEAMHRRALEGYKKTLGDEHPETLTSLANTAWAVERQGKYEEAEAMHRQALKGFEKILGPEHRDTLTSVSHLGSVLGRQEKYEETEALHRRALEGYEKALGSEHPYTLTSVNNLGSVLKKQGKYEEAEVMHRRDLEGSGKVLGTEHPDTLTSIGNLASVLEMQKNYQEAERMHQRALKGREKVLGHEHPDTLTSVNNLGLVLERQGKYQEAEAMYQRALHKREKILGHNHPDTVTSASNLGLVLERQGRYEDAETIRQLFV